MQCNIINLKYVIIFKGTLGCLFPCALSSMVSSRLGESPLTCLFPGSTASLRTRMRTLYGIEVRSPPNTKA